MQPQISSWSKILENLFNVKYPTSFDSITSVKTGAWKAVSFDRIDLEVDFSTDFTVGQSVIKRVFTDRQREVIL